MAKGLMCNPGSQRCVDPDGKIGRLLQGKTNLPNTRITCPKTRQANCKAEGKICNPKTRQCVVAHGERGQILLKNHHYLKHHNVSHIVSVLGKNTAGKKLPADVRSELVKTLKVASTFDDAYHAEHAELEHNMQNSRKRGALKRLFTSAKNSLASILAFARRHPAYAILLLAVLSTAAGGAYATAYPSGNFAVALNSALSAAGVSAPATFVREHWATMREAVKQFDVSAYMTSMNGFVQQLKDLMASVGGYFSPVWERLATTITTSWNNLLSSTAFKVTAVTAVTAVMGEKVVKVGVAYSGAGAGHQLIHQIRKRVGRVCSVETQAMCKAEGKICNPKTEQCVVPHGKRGKQLLQTDHYLKHHDVSHVLHAHVPGVVAKTTNTLPAAVKKDLQHTLKTVGEFDELYQEEHAELEHNMKNSHKRGVLRRMFASAKNSLLSIVSFAKRHPAYAILLVAVLAASVTGGVAYAYPGGKLAFAVNKALATVQLPAGTTAPQFIAQNWAAMTKAVQTYKASTFIPAMNAFVTQLGTLVGSTGQYFTVAWQGLSNGVIAAWQAFTGLPWVKTLFADGILYSWYGLTATVAGSTAVGSGVGAAGYYAARGIGKIGRGIGRVVFRR
jgi:hypothetical protein